MPKERNLLIVDDILIKTGCVFLVLNLLVGTVVWVHIADRMVNGPGTVDWWLLAFAIVFLLLPIVFLAAGYTVRFKEKRYLIIWKILEKTLEASVTDISDNTGMTRDTILTAIREINRRGEAFYIYDRKKDLIYDGRLKSQTVVVESCPACGHRMGEALPLIVSRIPSCRYCGSVIDINYINRLKLDKVRLMRDIDLAMNQAALPDVPQRRFNFAVFFFLLIFCWPAALIYAIHKNGRSFTA